MASTLSISCRQAVMDLLSPTEHAQYGWPKLQTPCGWRDVGIASVSVTAEAKKENICCGASGGPVAMW